MGVSPTKTNSICSSAHIFLTTIFKLLQRRFQRLLPQDDALREIALAACGVRSDNCQELKISRRTPPPWDELGTLRGQRVLYRERHQENVQYLAPLPTPSVRYSLNRVATVLDLMRA